MGKKPFGPFFNPSNTRVSKTFRIIGMVFIGLIFAVCFALVFGFLVKWLWNWLLPGLFGFSEITYWQAFGIVILAKLLFGAFGSHHHDKGHGHPHPPLDWCSRFRPFEDAPWNRRSHFREDYHRYWEEEGKAAFEDYMRQRAANKQGEGAFSHNEKNGEDQT